MTNNHSFTGKVALVMGASRGIGAATALAFAAAGADVALGARDDRQLAEVAEQIKATGGRALPIHLDVTDPESVRHCVAATVGEFGRLDAAVNNATGGGHPPTPLTEVTVEDFTSAFEVNTLGVFLGMKYQIPAMLSGAGGAIVNVSSSAGLQGVGGLTGYATAKHAVIGLSRVAALDYAGQGIRVNIVAPGPILTDNLRRAGERGQHAATQAIPQGRVGAVDEVADAIVWLCSAEAGFITGATLPIDGGKLAGVQPFTRVLPPQRA
ncbi:SDR family NAD(P)-dependent oxidoreductase [Nocardia jejuensis]|uniref:SDR family NAD(P)-dependent oxidoreductase n=1 Tax=Nocardia jejuensis TaxID=328049 RepID=UPI00082A4E38|nr:glucose 1-dehydrogenase [Nocardia jejuensis]